MRPARRPSAPAVLAEHGDAWSAEYAQRRRDNPTYRFQWKSHGGERVNKIIEPALKQMTDDHCAYCDGFPLDATGRDTIDHFLPKAHYPELSYAWENLYLACHLCQNVKEVQFDRPIDRDTYDHSLLCPDEDGYSFERYFLYNFESGEIEVNPAASDRDRVRAAYTIRCLGMNAGSRPQTRRRQLHRYDKLPPEDREYLDDWPYRFLLESVAAE